jgi:hypothetical protein
VSGRLEPCIEILPPAQRRLWPKLAPAAELGLVLYGGTAIALRLGHRQSIDFDFFTERPLDRDSLHRAMPFLRESLVLQDQADSLGLLVPCAGDGHEQVKVSFFGRIEFGRVGEPDRTDDGMLVIASLDDLMATKLKVVLQRVESKDYRDIAAMLEAGVSLAKGLASARQLFGPAFQPSESLKALVYFEGGDLATLTGSEREVLIRAASTVRELPESALLSTSLLPAVGGRRGS